MHDFLIPMMLRRLQPTLLTWAVVVLFAAACSRDPEAGTPAAAAEGERLMRQMSDTLAKLPAFRFATVESLEEIGPPATRRVLRFSRTVTVRRPDAMFFELHGAAGTAVEVLAYYDGRTVSLRDDAQGVWAQTAVPGTIDEMLDDVARRYSVPVPIADVVYSVPYDAFIGRSTKGGFVGREIIDGVDCARLDYTDDFVDVRVWIPSSAQPLPRRVELVYKQVPGAPMARIDFTSWDLTPQIDDRTFTFQPGEAAKQIPFEQFASRLLSGGQPADSATLGGRAPGGAARR
jgi:hypothetical protein